MSVFTVHPDSWIIFSKFSYTLDSLISACIGRIFSGFLWKVTSTSTAGKQHDGHCLFYTILKIGMASEHENNANLCYGVVHSNIA